MQQEKLEFFASCLAGLEAPLADELKALGIRSVRPLGGGVAFFCDVRHALAACLWSRLASRIMLVVGRVDARLADLLFEDALELPWEDVIAPGASIAVSAHGMNDELRNTRFTALKVKDAVCDRLREARGERPNVDAEHPDAAIDVRVREKRATISLDLSGASLYRRTYLAPDDGAEAPLECALAAGLLALAGWDGRARAGAACVDAACGDGAVVVEAASAACDLAPGLARDRWGFHGWAGFDEDAWADLLDDADARFERGLAAAAAQGAVDGPASARPDLGVVRFAGLSASSPAIARARGRAKRAGLRQAVSIEPGGAEESGRARGARERRSCRRTGRRRRTGGRGPRLPGGERARRPRALLGGERPGRRRRVRGGRHGGPGGLGVRGGGQRGRGGPLRPGAGHARRARARPRGRWRRSCSTRRPPPPPWSWCPILPAVPSTAWRCWSPLPSSSPSRLFKVAKERRKWARREGVSCYRVYDADLPDYAVAIDVYAGAGEAEGNTYLHIAEYAPPSSVDPARARRRFDDVLALAPVALGIRPDHVFAKTRRRDKGGSQYRDAGRRSYVTQVDEDGYLMEVDLSGYLDTGIFLDHRATRELVGAKAAGKRFLNLFAYTGTATVHAAGGGAVETTTVDLSQTYLDWARRNMAGNGFAGPEHSFERADVMAWITETRRKPLRYDLIFVDPPTFSNSKAMGSRTWDVQRDHVELLIGVTRLLTEGGEAVFSCNLRTFKPDLEALARYGVALEDITASTIPHDFERNPKIHQCYLARRA